MKNITYLWFVDNKQEIFNTTPPEVYCVISDKIEVHTGNVDDCNMQYCENNNIPVYDLYRIGGTIVCCDGTIGIATITDVRNGWMNSRFSNAFIDFLKSKNLNPTLEKNDILLNGYKTASSAEWRVGTNLLNIYGVYLISYDVDLEAIRNICKKEMKKVPKGLKEFGLTKNEIINWCENYFSSIS